MTVHHLPELTDEIRVAVLRELLADADSDLLEAIGRQHRYDGVRAVTDGRRIRNWIAQALEALGVEDIPEIPHG